MLLFNVVKMHIVLSVLNALISGNEILLIKRAKKPYKGYWTMPGGKIKPGEHIEDAALRELKEETGIDANFSGIRGIVSEILHKKNDKKKAHFLMFVSELKCRKKNFVESDEGQLKWFKISDLQKNHKKIFPSDFKMIHEFIIAKKASMNIHKIKIKEKENSYSMESFKC